MYVYKGMHLKGILTKHRSELTNSSPSRSSNQLISIFLWAEPFERICYLEILSVLIDWLIEQVKNLTADDTPAYIKYALPRFNKFFQFLPPMRTHFHKGGTRSTPKDFTYQSAEGRALR